MRVFPKPEGFDWDEGNRGKNWTKHRVTDLECEEIFFNEPIAVGQDKSHSTVEKRYSALGRTDTGRLLCIIFTIRDNKIRVISARPMSRKERRPHEESSKI